MLTVEYLPESSDVYLAFDRDGGAYLIELIKELMEAKRTVDFDILSGQHPLLGGEERLSEKKLTASDKYQLASMLTVEYIHVDKSD